MRSSSKLVFVLTVVAAVAMLIIGIGANPAYAGSNQVPFEGTVSGTAIVDLGAGTIELAGTGMASHLGNVKSYKANGSLTSPTTDTLIETFTAANGDTLTIQCDQVLEEIGPLVFRGTDTWTVIGGTGRFSGATGSGTGETNVNLNVGQFTKQLTGNISY